MTTLLDVLARMESREDRAVSVYDRRGKAVGALSHAALARQARAIGARLLAEGVVAGQHVFIQLPTSHAQIATFLGAVAVGAVPCLLAPARALGGIDAYRAHMARLFATFPRSRLIVEREAGEESGVPYLEPLEPDLAGPLAPLREAGADDLAFVQLTSGSTRAPKAVRILHRSVAANLDAITRGARIGPDDDIVGWLPLHHDMGLVGILLTPLYAGADLFLLKPETFLARPATWLQAISDAPGPSITTAPNFAYRHAVESVPEEAIGALDLSRLRVAGCGAEPVRPDTLASFAARFARAGFRDSAFVPCYGMAEVTLAVTFGPGGRAPVIRRGAVSCAPPLDGFEVVIRDRDGGPLPEGAEGEVTVRGPSLCDGYEGAEVTSPFRDGWLLTGDRGFLEDGEIHITGRFKDLIIVDGVNVAPEDLEWLAQGVADVRAGRAGAFGVEVGGRERAVVVVEVTLDDAPRFAALADEVAERVAGAFGFRPYDIVFVRRGAIPKTTSGKVQRGKLRDDLASGALEALWRRSGAGAAGAGAGAGALAVAPSLSDPVAEGGPS